MKLSMVPRNLAVFLVVNLLLPGSLFALRMTQEGTGLEELQEALAPSLASPEGPEAGSETKPAAGLEEDRFLASIGLDRLDFEDLILVKTIAEVDPQAEGKVYLLKKRPKVSEVERLLQSRRREYGIYGLKIQGVARLAIGIGSEGDLVTDPRFLTVLYPLRKEVKLAWLVHNHDQGPGLPSAGDFYSLRGSEAQIIEERSFIYGSRTGRLIQFGVDSSRPAGSPSGIRLRLLREGDQETQEIWIPGTRRWSLSSLGDRWLQIGRPVFAQFYGALRSQGVIRVEVEDRYGRWFAWDRRITLARLLLEEAGWAQPAAGLEEERGLYKNLRASYEEVMEQLNRYSDRINVLAIYPEQDRSPDQYLRSGSNPPPGYTFADFFHAGAQRFFGKKAAQQTYYLYIAENYQDTPGITYAEVVANLRVGPSTSLDAGLEGGRYFDSLEEFKESFGSDGILDQHELLTTVRRFEAEGEEVGVWVVPADAKPIKAPPEVVRDVVLTYILAKTDLEQMAWEETLRKQILREPLKEAIVTVVTYPRSGELVDPIVPVVVVLQRGAKLRKPSREVPVLTVDSREEVHQLTSSLLYWIAKNPRIGPILAVVRFTDGLGKDWFAVFV